MAVSCLQKTPSSHKKRKSQHDALHFSTVDSGSAAERDCPRNGYNNQPYAGPRLRPASLPCTLTFLCYCDNFHTVFCSYKMTLTSQPFVFYAYSLLKNRVKIHCTGVPIYSMANNAFSVTVIIFTVCSRVLL